MGMFLFLVALGAAGAVAFIYNRLIRSRNQVNAAWSDIDVQLQRRHDLIPQLVTAVDQYAKYERATVEAVTALRNEAMHVADVRGKGRAEEKLSIGVNRLLALAENYPDLKANQNFLALQEELVETENYLQFARRYYNASVRDFNTSTQTFPNNLIAGRFDFVERDYFQKSSDEAANVPLVKMDASQ